MDNYKETLDNILKQQELVEELKKAAEEKNEIKKEEIEDLAKSLEEINRMSAHIEKTAAIYKFDQAIQIVPIFDPHIGLKTTNLKKLKETVNYILETPNCYTLLGGDFLECATKTSVGLAMYEEDFSIKDQFLFAFNLLKPLAEAKKILGSLTGNHEMRLANFADINPMELLAAQLNIPYFKYQGFIVIKIKNNIYKVGFSHGVGAATTPAGAVNAMRKQSEIVEADIFFSGHIHVKKVDSDYYNIINTETGKLEKRVRKYVICGSFVEYWDSYAEMKLFSPSDTGVIRASFSDDRWAIKVDIPE